MKQAKTGAAARGDKPSRRRGIADALQYHATLRVLLSVVIALLLWLTLYTSINPPGTKTVGVPVSIRNRSSLEEKKLILRNEPNAKNVTLLLKGRQEDLDQLTENNFEATLDLSKIESVDDSRLKIDLASTNTDRVTVARMTPSDVFIDLEQYLSVQLDIDVQVVGEETLPEGYILSNLSWQQRQLTIQGRSSLVDQASHAVAVVDLEGQAGSGVARPECKVISVEGEEMGVLDWVQTIDVSYEISKEVQVVADVTGTPEDNIYYVLGVDVQPQSVYVNGSKDALADVERLYTERVDVTDERASLMLSKYIIVPGGLRITTAFSPTQAVVDITIEKYNYQRINISKSNISLVNSDPSGSYQYEITQSEISFLVRGKRDDMNDLKPEDASAVVNVGGLRPGTSRRPLIVTLPDGVTVAGNPVVDIIVWDVNAQLPAEPDGADGGGGADDAGGGDGAIGGVDGADDAGGGDGAIGGGGDGAIGGGDMGEADDAGGAGGTDDVGGGDGTGA